MVFGSSSPNYPATATSSEQESLHPAYDHSPSYEEARGPERFTKGSPFVTLDSREHDQHDRFSDDWVPMLPHPKPGSHKRHRRRRSRVVNLRPARISSLFKAMLWMIPLTTLVAFGVLHVLEVLVGRASLFWNPHFYAPESMEFGGLDFARAELGRYTTAEIIPIPCHSHNDYLRKVPLVDALRYGCTSVEADVWLFDEELYVGHRVGALERNRTFHQMYVAPLLEMLDSKDSTPSAVAAGSSAQGIFDTRPDQTLVLLVDLKNIAEEAFTLLHQHLEPLRQKDYLTHWDGENLISRAITIVCTGNTPFHRILETPTHRDIFFDAPLEVFWQPPRLPISLTDPLRHNDADLDYGDAMSRLESPTQTPPSPKDIPSPFANPDLYNSSNSYYASTDFTSTIGFVWRGHLSPRQMTLIRGQIRGAKQKGLKVRYWNAPTWPISLRDHVWHVLVKEGADVLNVNDLRSAAVVNWKVRVHELWF